MARLLIFFVFVSGMVNSLPFHKSGKGEKDGNHVNDPIFDDDTTTPPLSTARPVQQTPTPMPIFKYRTIQQILRYKHALRGLATSHGTPSQNWKAQSAQFRLDENDLANMTASELHGILGSIKHFYSATLSDLCCLLG